MMGGQARPFDGEMVTGGELGGREKEKEYRGIHADTRTYTRTAPPIVNWQFNFLELPLAESRCD